MNDALQKRLDSASSMGPEYADSVTRYLSTIGSKGGSSKSPAKVSAAKANGAKGGRPKKNKPVHPLLVS